jgi:Aerotolerance regulator N-terminal
VASLVFLQSSFLLGLFAVALPIAIHLIHRQRRRRVRFSALRFLLQTDRRSARKYRIIDILVLILRTLLLLLLALALAQPVVRPPGTGDMEFGKLSLGIVIDDSMSMGRTSNGVRLFDHALDAAKTIVSEIPQDAEAFVVLSSGRTPKSLSAPASPPASLADLIGDLECSFSARPLAKSINETVQVLSGAKNPHRALVVIGDMQKRSLDSETALDADRFEKEIQSIQFVDVGGDDANLAIDEVSASPEICFPGTPIRIHARVYNAGAEPAEARVSFWVENEKVHGETLDLQAHATGDVTFTHVLRDPGTYHATVRLEPDGLSADNARYLSLRALQPMEVLLVTPGDSNEREALFLHMALDPLRTPTVSGVAPVHVQLATYASARAMGFEGSRFVFVIDSGTMPERLAQAIDDFTESGGNVLYFPGLGLLENAGNPESLEGKNFGGLTLRGAWKRSTGEEATGIGELDRDHPIFALLNRTVPELFNAVGITAYLDIDERRLEPGDRVIARTTDGAPLVVESQRGEGSALVWATGCHPKWTDLPLRPLFLPLLYESLKYAQAGAGARIRHANVDDGFSVEVAPTDSARSVRIKLPTGQIKRRKLAANRPRLDFHEASQPGFYEAEIIGEGLTPVAVALNFDAAESRLERLEEEGVADAFPKLPPVQIAESGTQAARRLSYTTQGYGLAGWLLALALLALLGEIYLSNTLLRSEEERPGWLQHIQNKLGRT